MDHGPPLHQQRAAAAALYKPKAVRLLLVAQTPPVPRPPDPPRYFYFEKVVKHDDLFRGVVRAVLGAEPDRSMKHVLLGQLRDAGVFMIDLKPDPEDPHDLAEFVPSLVERCRELNPDRIILIKTDVYDAAFRPLRDSGLPVIDVRIPFPGSGRQTEFAQQMQKALACVGK